jgi:tetratricopeptide (TPR) repeat protein
MKTSYLRFKIFLILSNFFVILFLFSCQQKNTTQRYNFGTENDSALFYYNKGWEYILDYGQWTLSEESYRKAITLDPSFTLGKGIVGKITTTLDERIAILKDLEVMKEHVSQDERLLLDDLLLILQLMNARDEGITLSPEFFNKFYTSAEKNMQTFIHKYPHESYIKAEYIEVIHANHGAQLALDSIDALTTSKQKILPFFISYAATLESELGNFEKALAKAKELKNIINNDKAPAIYFTYAQLFLDMDSLDLAKKNIEKTIQLDIKHQLAYRVKARINQKLKTKQSDSIN